MNEDNVKKVIANNLIKYRKNAKLTQLELAEKLAYSDKNISKWERGDSIPDVLILKQLAEMYNISVNDFFDESNQVVSSKQKFINKHTKTKAFNKKQFLIILNSYSLVWLVAVVAYMSLMFTPFKEEAWKVFILALPLGAVVILIFTSIWCTNLLNSLAVSVLIWTTALAFSICVPINNAWLIYIVAIPIQIMDMLWFSLRKVNKNIKTRQKEQNKETKEENV